jgi:cyclopropane-fatty-acyl-phospholipid synthase
MRKAEEIVAALLNLADITVNGGRPWDMQVHDRRVFTRILREGSLGLGEAYLDGWWDAHALDEFFAKVLAAELDQKIRGDWRTLLRLLGRRLWGRLRPASAYHIGAHHYDIGNDLYAAMLDRRQVYSCAYWDGADTLDEAQEAKLDLVCRKLRLRPGQHLLDIGCGWGGFAKFAAARYGVSVVGVTVSQAQVDMGRELCAGLPVELQYKDYREIAGEFDHIVSLGMFEHVGRRHYRTYFRVAHAHLKPDGLFLLHTIGQDVSQKTLDPWFGKYIFPDSLLPSPVQITQALEGLFVIEDWHNFGAHYDRTLMAWLANFQAHWEALRPKYGDRFFRMWKYYLCAAAGAFRARKNQVWQIVLAKTGMPGGYASVR